MRIELAARAPSPDARRRASTSPGGRGEFHRRRIQRVLVSRGTGGGSVDFVRRFWGRCWLIAYVYRYARWRYAAGAGNSALTCRVQNTDGEAEHQQDREYNAQPAEPVAGVRVERRAAAEWEVGRQDRVAAGGRRQRCEFASAR